ncbi:MAG: cyclic nucleotide-binding domain-containing protein [Rhodospirillaceae bacterium]
MAKIALNSRESEIVLTCPLFNGLSAAMLEAMIEDARIVNYQASTQLFSRGDPADRVFVVLGGQVRLYILTAQGDESVIDFIEPGRSFAEAAVFGNGGMPVNGEARAGSRLLHIPARSILSRVEQDAEVARRMMEALAHWQRQLIERVHSFKVRSSGQRLAAALLAQIDARASTATVRLPVSKGKLASLIGITPENLSRRLARLREFGVTSQASTVAIADVAKLRRYAEGQDDQP